MRQSHGYRAGRQRSVEDQGRRPGLVARVFSSGREARVEHLPRLIAMAEANALLAQPRGAIQRV
jgi:hypothetical protein